MRSNKRRKIINNINEDKMRKIFNEEVTDIINEDIMKEIVKEELNTIFEARDKKLETNPAKINLVIILSLAIIFIGMLFVYGFYMYFWIETLEATLFVFIFTQALYIVAIIGSLRLINRIIKNPIRLWQGIISGIIILSGVIISWLQSL